MKQMLLILIAVFSMTLTGCKNKTADPQSILSDFFDALSKKDINTARTLCTAESKSILDMLEIGLVLDSASNESLKYDKSQIELGEPKIEGENATIAVKNKNDKESIDFYLKKENNVWKVAFDLGTLMKIGMNEVKEKGVEMLDSLVTAPDENQKVDINLDSLKKGLRDGIKKLDSVKRLLKREQ